AHRRWTIAPGSVAGLEVGLRWMVAGRGYGGLGRKADVWLRLRPGTDGALALGLANIMIERGWYDRQFIRDWSNGPLLVRADTGRLLRESDLAAGGDAKKFVAWNLVARRAAVYDPDSGRYDGGSEPLALDGEVSL